MSDDEIPRRPQGIPEDLWEDIFPPDRKAILEIAARYFVQGCDPLLSFEKALNDADEMLFMAGRHKEIYQVLGPLMGCDTNLLPFPHVRAACEAVTNTSDVFWRDIVASDNPVRTAFQKRLWWRPNGACLICGYSSGTDVSDGGLRFSRVDGGIDSIHSTCAEGFKLIGKAFGDLVLKESLAKQGKVIEHSRLSCEAIACEENEDDDDGYWSVQD